MIGATLLCRVTEVLVSCAYRSGANDALLRRNAMLALFLKLQVREITLSMKRGGTPSGNMK